MLPINFDDYQNIYDKDEKLRFINDTYATQNDDVLAKVLNRLDSIGIFESQLYPPKDLCAFTFLEYVTLFEQQQWTKKTTFYIMKTFIVTYVGWAVRVGKAPYEQLSVITNMVPGDLSGYFLHQNKSFKNLDSLCSAHEEIIKNEIFRGRACSNDSYITAEIITYLAWLRLSSEEAVRLQKSDVDVNGHKIVLKDREVEIPDKIYNRMIYYAMLTGFEFSNGISTYVRIYKDSKYYLRSHRTDRLSENPLRTTLSRYSGLALNLDPSNEFYKKSFTYDSIKQSSLFDEFYQCDVKNPTNIEKMSSLAGDRLLGEFFPHDTIALGISSNYLSWRKFFYGV